MPTSERCITVIIWNALLFLPTLLIAFYAQLFVLTYIMPWFGYPRPTIEKPGGMTSGEAKTIADLSVVAVYSCWIALVRLFSGRWASDAVWWPVVAVVTSIALIEYF